MKISRKRLIGVVVGLVFVAAAVYFLALRGPAVGNILSSIDGALDNQGYAAATGFYDTAEEPAADLLIAQDRAQTAQPEQDRIILKSATLTIIVTDPASTVNELAAMAEAMGGWVVSSSTYSSAGPNNTEITNGSITIRVPAERLNEALSTIKSGAGKVEAENVSGQDVTEDYIDLSSRLETLKTSETQLQTIMTSAKKVEDVLNIQRELTTIRSDIEVIEGRLQYYEQSAAYSAIAVTVRQQQPGVVEAQSAGWNPLATAEQALGWLVRLAQSAADLVITLAIIGLPLLILLGLPARVIWRRRSAA